MPEMLACPCFAKPGTGAYWQVEVTCGHVLSQSRLHFGPPDCVGCSQLLQLSTSGASRYARFM